MGAPNLYFGVEITKQKQKQKKKNFLTTSFYLGYALILTSNFHFHQCSPGTVQSCSKHQMPFEIKYQSPNT